MVGHRGPVRPVCQPPVVFLADTTDALSVDNFTARPLQTGRAAVRSGCLRFRPFSNRTAAEFAQPLIRPDVAPAVNQCRESSRRVRYLRGTVEVSNFCKSASFQRFGNRVARESLRRGLCTGSPVPQNPARNSRTLGLTGLPGLTATRLGVDSWREFDCTSGRFRYGVVGHTCPPNPRRPPCDRELMPAVSGRR